MNIPPNACFVLTNDDAGDDVTDAVLAQIAAAIDYVLAHSFRDAYGGAYTCQSAAQALPPNGPAVTVTLKASSDVAGAAGYHDDGGIYCFRDGLPSLTSGDFAFSVVISHEIFEAAGDPGANRWADSGTGSEYALELCDAVEGFSFTPECPPTDPGAGVSVSDFLLPSFFDPSGVRPFSRCDKPTAPLSTAPDSGADYQIVRSVNENGDQQVTAVGAIRTERQKAKAHPSSRTARRGVVFGVLASALACLLVGCQQLPAISADVVNEVDCVEAQLLAGNDTFEGIALACSPALVSDVVTIVATELAKEAGPLPALAARVHHVTPTRD
jgi:hypothetical protein